MLMVPTNAVLSQYFDKKRGKALSLATTGNGIGAMAVSTLAQYFILHYSYAGTFLIFGGLTLHFCISGALYRPLEISKLVIDVKYIEMKQMEVTEKDTNDPDMEISIDDVENETKVIPGEATQHPDLNQECNHKEVIHKQHKSECCKSCLRYVSQCFGFQLFKNQNFLTFCILLLFLFLATDINISFMTSIAREKGFLDGDITLLLICANSVDIPARLITGVIFDLPKIREHRRLAYAILAFAFSAIDIVIPYVRGRIGILFIWVAIAAVRGALMCQGTVVVAHITGMEDITSAIGLTRFFQGTGILLGPTLGG